MIGTNYSGTCASSERAHAPPERRHTGGMTTSRARYRLIHLALAAILIALAAGTAFAMDVPFDPVAWGNTPALALAALVGFIAWVRTTPVGAHLDGPVKVPIATAVVGAAAGAALQIAGILTYAPYATWASPLGGIVYGLLVAATAVTGVSLFNYGASKVRATTVTVASPTNAVVSFITDFLKARFAGSIPGAAWNAVSGILAQYATHEGVLTDDLRASLQRRLLDALRGAGLPGVDLE